MSDFWHPATGHDTFFVCFRPYCNRSPGVAIWSKVFDKNSWNHFDLSLVKVAKMQPFFSIILIYFYQKLLWYFFVKNDIDLSLAKVANMCKHFDLFLAKT